MKIHNRVLRQGDGMPLILVNAYPVDGRMWEVCAGRIVALADEAGLPSFPIWAPDMPGSGLSPVPAPEESGPQAQNGSYPQGLDRLCDAYVDFLEAGGRTRAVWAGLSMGGYVVSNLWRRHAGAVAGLALIDTMACSDGVGGEARLAGADALIAAGTVDPVMHFAQPAEGDSSVKRSPAFIDQMTAWIHEQSPEGCAWRQRMVYGRADLDGVPETIDVPTAVVSGDNDPSSNPKVMRPLAERIGGNATFTDIPDCGHFSAVERPDHVAKSLVALMERVL